jgi:Leucine-rich repeat (LRR) protein
MENLKTLTKLELLEFGDNQLRQIENLDTMVNLKEL